MNYLIREHRPNEPIPYGLLLLADENQLLIDKYILTSRLYVLETDDNVVGVGVLQIRGAEGEIMNIAVAPDYQRKGLGRALVRALTDAAAQQGVVQLRIATGNCGIGQIALYQQEGFELIGIDRNYMLRNYPNPIWENGIQCKHQLIFEKYLRKIMTDEH